jgi:hypothetical protein
MHSKERPPQLSAAAAANGLITLRRLINQENSATARPEQAPTANGRAAHAGQQEARA